MQRFDTLFGFLKDHPKTVAAISSGASIGQVHNAVTRLFATGDADKARTMVATILKDTDPDSHRPHATGELDDWFNLSVTLGQQDEFALAAKCALAGLAQQGVVRLGPDYHIEMIALSTKHADDNGLAWPPNVDLWAHALNYAQKVGRHDAVTRLLDCGKNIPEGLLNWRYYTFLGEYYTEADDEDNFTALMDEFERQLPMDERSMSQRLQWMEKHNQHEKALEIGKNWLANPASRGSAVPLRLAEMALGARRYEDVLAYTAAGLEGHAEAQPSAEIAALLFDRAAAHDGLMLQALRAEPVDCERALGHYQNALRYYGMDLLKRQRHYHQVAQDRIVALRELMEEHGCIEPSPQTEPSEPEPDGIGARDAAEAVRAILTEYSVCESDAERQALIAQVQENPALSALLKSIAEDEDAPEPIRDVAKALSGQ